MLHPGHVKLLSEARRLCDCLVVGLNNDASVRRLKGETRPIQNEMARATILATMSPIDALVLFEEDTPLDLIELVKPDVWSKGRIIGWRRWWVVNSSRVTVARYIWWRWKKDTAPPTSSPSAKVHRGNENAGFEMDGSGVLLLLLATSAAGADDSLDGLLTSLADTEDALEAREIERKIWAIWNDSGDETLESLYRQGRGFVQIGQLGEARDTFSELIDKAPGFAEGWNQRATVYYFMNQFEASLADIERTLELEPRHYGRYLEKPSFSPHMGNMSVRWRHWTRCSVSIRTRSVSSGYVPRSRRASRRKARSRPCHPDSARYTTSLRGVERDE